MNVITCTQPMAYSQSMVLCYSRGRGQFYGVWGHVTHSPQKPETLLYLSHDSLFKAVSGSEDPGVRHQGPAADVDPPPPHACLPRPLARYCDALPRLRGAGATLPARCKGGWIRLTRRPLSCPHHRPDPMSLELTVLSCLKTWEERDTGETGEPYLPGPALVEGIGFGGQALGPCL